MLGREPAPNGEREENGIHAGRFDAFKSASIPPVIGTEADGHEIWHASSDARQDYVGEIPNEILNAITPEEITWIAQSHDSAEFRGYRQRHIERYHELATARGIENRAPLGREAAALLDNLKMSCD